MSSISSALDYAYRTFTVDSDTTLDTVDLGILEHGLASGVYGDSIREGALPVVGITVDDAVLGYKRTAVGSNARNDDS